jgi:hypothetical protein
MTDVEIEFAPTVEATLVYRRGRPTDRPGRPREHCNVPCWTEP